MVPPRHLLSHYITTTTTTDRFADVLEFPRTHTSESLADLYLRIRLNWLHPLAHKPSSALSSNSSDSTTTWWHG